MHYKRACLHRYIIFNIFKHLRSRLRTGLWYAPFLPSISSLLLTFGASGSGAFGAAGVAGAADPAVPSSSSSKKSAPTSTVSPSPARYYLMTPETGVVMSTVTLSVSILATISSASTNSPGPVEKVENKVRRVKRKAYL